VLDPVTSFYASIIPTVTRAWLSEGGRHVGAVIENVCGAVLVVNHAKEVLRSPLPEAL
jgi:hypothetical protein